VNPETPRTRTAPRFEERVVVATFSFPWEAELARARLGAEGIGAVLGDENLVRLDWFVSQAVGGVKLLVAASDAPRAAAVLSVEAQLPEIGLATASDSSGGPSCPRCQSGNLTYERWSRAGFVGTILLFGFPLPIPQPRWRCGRCKAVWRPEELEAAP
jgi:hypothetical protein